MPKIIANRRIVEHGWRLLDADALLAADDPPEAIAPDLKHFDFVAIRFDKLADPSDWDDEEIAAAALRTADIAVLVLESDAREIERRALARYAGVLRTAGRAILVFNPPGAALAEREIDLRHGIPKQE